MSGRPVSQGGYTLVEVAFVCLLALAGLTVLGSVVGGTEDLSKDTRLHTRASSEHRRNLRTITDLLRGAEASTLEGFDDQGIATWLQFQRVTGVDVNTRDYEPARRLVWVPVREEVWGVPTPGRLVLIGTDGVGRIVAENVPQDGFVVRRQGNTLSIQLTTYYTLGPQRTFRTTSETAVSLRN